MLRNKPSHEGRGMRDERRGTERMRQEDKGAKRLSDIGKRRIEWFLFVSMSLSLFVGVSLLLTPALAAAPPVLYFSDLPWGPKAGWEGSSTKGAAVTVWGKNFGSTRGSSYVTVNGAQVNSGDYAEWDVIGPARGLERITFYLNSSMTDGVGTISVTVGGNTSNTVPFTIAAGTIYFVSVTDGSNTYNGLYSVHGSASNGPFHDLYMFNPGLDAYHDSAHRNPSGDGQYLMYVRGGTYTTQDSYVAAFVSLLSKYGSSTKQKGLIAYPGETPILNMDNSQNVVYTPDDLPSGATCCAPSYMTFAKLSAQKVSTCASGGNGCNGAFNLILSDYIRVVGNTMTNLLPTGQFWSGTIFVGDSKHDRIFGNYFNHVGYDSYMHDIYIKTQLTYSCCGGSNGTLNLATQDIDVGWNEFNNPYASDGHGGDIFVSHGSDTSYTTNPTDQIYIHHNYWHDGNTEFFYSGDNTPLGGSVYLYGNVMARGGQNGFGGINVYCGSQHVYIYNNTFYQTSADTSRMMWEESYPACGAVPTTHLSNNIWHGMSGQTFLSMSNWGSPTAAFDHELFYDPGGTTTPPASGNGVSITNTTLGNPLFVNSGSSDFHLQSTSPGRGSGANLTSSMTSLPWGLYDYDGKAYPASGAWDAGPLQYAAGTPPPPAPVITSTTLATGTVGTAFSYQITATNSPTSYNATGLSAGLSVNTNTGLISGAPTSTGTYNVSLSATNSSGTGTATLTLTLYSACDLNQDNSTNVIDVQLEVNMALGATPCTGDINKDGVCNVADVQRVINSALGGACVSS